MSRFVNVVPDHFEGVEATTEEQIKFLGKENIRRILQSLRSSANGTIASMKKITEDKEFFKDINKTRLFEIAKTYENPSSIVAVVNSTYKELEPVDQASLLRKKDATTFNFCGWCKYASESTGVFGRNYCLTCGCSFLEYLPYQESESGFGYSFKFNSPCYLLRNADPEKLINRIREAINSKLKKENQDKKDLDDTINFLFSIEKQAESKPYLPSIRPFEWFNINEPVMCNLRQKNREKYPTLVWVSGNVVSGIRHHDGLVNVYCNTAIHNNLDYHQGCGTSYDYQNPSVMHDWELNYLAKHYDFAKIYVNAVSRYLDEYNAEQLLKDILDQLSMINFVEESECK